MLLTHGRRGLDVGDDLQETRSQDHEHQQTKNHGPHLGGVLLLLGGLLLLPLLLGTVGVDGLVDLLSAGLHVGGAGGHSCGGGL